MTPNYSLSEALERVADLAPTLKEAELRVLLELTRRAIYKHPDGVRASSRDLASCCKIERKNVQLALDSLNQRCLISTRQGTATQAAVHLVNILSTVRMGGVTVTPPSRRPDDATLEFFQPHPGVETTPPPTDSTALTPTGARVDEVPTFGPILDRVLKSKPRNFDPEEIAYFRRWLHGYMRKFGRDDRNQPTPDAHPPDDELIAQFLATGEAPALTRLLDTLLAERKTCYSYSWFVTVALQRLHGIHFQQIRKAREQLRLIKAGNRAAQQPEVHQDELFTDTRVLLDQAIAGVKKLR